MNRWTLTLCLGQRNEASLGLLTVGLKTVPKPLSINPVFLQPPMLSFMEQAMGGAGTDPAWAGLVELIPLF